jgi:hypothetical protein
VTNHEAERTASFEAYLEHSAPYFAKVEAAGDRLWFSSAEQRRELFMRRHRRPEPPASVPTRTHAEIRGEHRRWTPVIPTQTEEMIA